MVEWGWDGLCSEGWCQWRGGLSDGMCGVMMSIYLTVCVQVNEELSCASTFNQFILNSECHGIIVKISDYLADFGYPRHSHSIFPLKPQVFIIPCKYHQLYLLPFKLLPFKLLCSRRITGFRQWSEVYRTQYYRVKFYQMTNVRRRNDSLN